MKRTILLILALTGLLIPVFSQNFNWRAFNAGQNHALTLQTGWDYGLTLGAGYAYKFNTKIPLLAGIEFSSPAGEHIFDDFKVRVGGQMQLVQLGSFVATAKVYSPIRRFENDLVRMFNFGAELSGVFGYYKPRWFAAGEFGFDKAVATHIGHTDRALEDYPGLQSGWYVPTGGNYNFGVQTGFSFRGNDLSLRAGRLASQGFVKTPLIPWYFQLGYSRRF